MGWKHGTPAERFWPKVAKGADDECWLWTASVYPNGYGQFKINYHMVIAHRWAYEELVGPIPDGLQLDHLCRVRRCVNPAHLEPVTGRVNLQRGIDAGDEFYCRHGHERASNARTGTSGCRKCSNDARNARRREAREVRDQASR